MKINSNFLPMKLHYFFIFGGTAPLLPYLPVYMKEKLNMSYKAIGLIYTVLPFFGLIAKASSGTLADWLRAHRTIFLSSILVCSLSFFSICFAPPMMTQDNPNPGHLQFDCSSPVSYLRHAFSRHKCGTAFQKDGPTTCELKCDTDQETVRKFCENWNITLSECSEEAFQVSAFVYQNRSVKDDTEIFIPLSNLTFTDIEVENPLCDQPLRINCTAKCDSDKLMTFLGASNKIPLSTYAEIVNQNSFWILLLLISIAWCALAICVVMSDTICFKLLGAEASKYGRQRMFGSIGWGASIIITGLLIDTTSSDFENKNYMSAFVLSLCILAVDLLVATRLKVEAESKENLKISAILSLASNPRIIMFMLCCFVVGISTGTLWTYQLMLVEQTGFQWDCNFEYIKLLQGLIIGVACFGGELPFFFLSGHFIKKLGHVHAMSLSIGAFGLRFVLYYLVSNPWLFLPIELLNGFTFGIFYSVMTSYASIVAPPGAQATMQGIVGGTFEGLGIASGSLVGGALFSTVGGAKTFLYVGIFNAAFAAVHVSLQILLNRLRPDQGYHVAHMGEGYRAPSDSITPVIRDENSHHLVSGDVDL